MSKSSQGIHNGTFRPVMLRMGIVVSRGWTPRSSCFERKACNAPLGVRESHMASQAQLASWPSGRHGIRIAMSPNNYCNPMKRQLFRRSSRDAPPPPADTSSAVSSPESTSHVRLSTGPLWCVGSAVQDGENVMIKGWLVRPDDSRAVVLVNGHPAETAEYARPDLEDVLIPGEGNISAGFRATIPESAAGGLELDLAVDGEPVESFTVWSPPADAIGPVPEPDSRERVHGSTDLDAFLVEGYTAYRQLDQLIQEYVPDRGDEPIRLLDWGVGCARVARYFVADRRYDLAGADIDGLNVKWCSEHLPGTFEHIEPMPPTVFDHDSFDVIIGVSVMTHLALDKQLAWLAHLRDLLVPGGIALLTTHGWTTARRSGLPREMIDSIESGFLDAGVNPNIPDTVVETGYYRNVFNTREQLEQEWTPSLPIIGFHPGLIGQHQDVVVLRKPD